MSDLTSVNVVDPQEMCPMVAICAGRFDTLDHTVTDLGKEVSALKVGVATGMAEMIAGLAEVRDKLSKLFPNGRPGILQEMRDDYCTKIEAVSKRTEQLEEQRKERVVEARVKMRIREYIAYLLAACGTTFAIAQEIHHWEDSSQTNSAAIIQQKK